MASLLDPYEDLNIDPDDTVEGILATKRKKGTRSEYLLESRINPYSTWSRSKPSIYHVKGTPEQEKHPGYVTDYQRSYWNLADSPFTEKAAGITGSYPLWSVAEWLPGTGVGTKVAGMVGSVAALPLKSVTLKKLLEDAKDLGLKTAVPIGKFITKRLEVMGYKKGINTKSVRKMLEPKKYGDYDYELADAIELRYNPVERKIKEDVLVGMGIKLPASGARYGENLREKYRYHTNEEYKLKTLLRNSQNISLHRAATREMREKDGAMNLPENLQIEMAHSRVRSVIENMKSEDRLRGGGFYLTDKDIVKLKKQLFPIKLKEIQEGTPLIQRMTIDHYHPRKGVVVRKGEEIGSGLTTWKNITNSEGKLRLLTMWENAQKGNIIPGRLLHPVQRKLRTTESGTSIMNL